MEVCEERTRIIRESCRTWDYLICRPEMKLSRWNRVKIQVLYSDPYVQVQVSKVQEAEVLDYAANFQLPARN